MASSSKIHGMQSVESLMVEISFDQALFGVVNGGERDRYSEILQDGL